MAQDFVLTRVAQAQEVCISIFDDLGCHLFANSVLHVLRFVLQIVRLFVSKLSLYLRSSFDPQEKHYFEGRRELITRKELQPKKQEKLIRCHFYHMEQAISENVVSYL